MFSKFYHYLVCFLLVLFMFSCNDSPSFISKKIEKNWLFKATKDSTWLPAKVPGSVHTDLLTNNVIENPFYRLNEKDLQWIDKKDWEYKTVFTVDKTVFDKQKIEFNFKGLDTYATIYLNDSLILKTNNMFIGYKIAIKQYIKLGENSLKIVFDSPIKEGLKKREALGYQLPNAVNDQSENGGLGKKKVAVFNRKAGYHFGWDWGPRLVSSGIWQEIELNAWNNAVIKDVYLQQQNISKEVAVLNAKLEIEAVDNISAEVFIKIDDHQYLEQEIALKKGVNKIDIPIKIKNPELWWTNGLGNQKLYKVDVTLKKGNNLFDLVSHKIGLKTLKVIQKKDSVGESFYFRLNGHAVFMKGANYIPQDVFLDRVTTKDYEKVIKNMVDANYNMVRVWGGGIYEKDIFYDLCDKYGILVWQDFMFACAMYPGDTSFLESVKKEAIYNVKRLRNHTSIALWCGNNENFTAWKNWGWIDEIKKNQGQETVDVLWNGYQNVFHEILPEIVAKFDNDTFYWASSPTSARGEDATLTAGDYHYWRVWGNQESILSYNEAIPRFMSEYGFQSFPDYQSVKKYTNKQDQNIYSDVMQSHQRSNIGNKNIEMYMNSWYHKPKDFQSFLYVSQLLQSTAMQIAIEAHRRNMPYCMGSLYWQINDCWPVASWSTIDYYGNWKAAHYTVKELYKPIKTMFYKNDDKLEVHIVSDKLKDKKALLKIKLINFKGAVLKETEKNVTIKQNTSGVYFDVNEVAFINGEKKENTFLVSELVGVDNVVFDETIFYLEKPNQLELLKPTIEYFVLTQHEKEVEIEISSNVLVKNIYLITSEKGHFSNNYFDVLPKKKYRIKFSSEEQINIEKFTKELKLISLFDTY
ncbi:beta-mannosidase [Polaribacter staleyi]|uniref:beta-mannosidase n=1 Tax=Polaribacter staleyi TaxID=2022337 RepID=UPI0031BA5C60